MNDEITREPYDGSAADEPPVDVIDLLDRLEELVGTGRRVPLSTRVIVEEDEFLAILDQIRAAVPREIRDAQRVVEERSEIIISAQQEAAKILDMARSQAEYGLAEAARYVKLPTATLRSCVVVRAYPTSAGVLRFQPYWMRPEWSRSIFGSASVEPGARQV